MTTIRSIRVFSAAKVSAVLYGIMGLLIAPFVLLGPGLAAVGGGRRGFGGAIFVAAVLPVFYAVIGFIMGALMAFIYNAISHSIGGIEVELESPLPASPSVSSASSSFPVSAPVSPSAPPAPPEFE